MSKKIAFCGVFVALALILSYIENLIKIPIPVPGIKLGLANIVTVILIYVLSPKEAFYVSVFRVLLGGFLFGSVSSIIYSLSGCLCSCLFMFLARKVNKFSIIGVSVVGGVFHNFAQILVVSIVVNNFNLLYYLPFLVIAGIVTGVLIGFVSFLVVSKLKIKFN